MRHAALAMLATDEFSADLVFSDVIMPGMNGVEFANIIRERYPGLPVVLTSGYSEVLAENAHLGFELIQKPYSVESLSRILRKAIAERAPVVRDAAAGQHRDRHERHGRPIVAVHGRRRQGRRLDAKPRLEPSPLGHPETWPQSLRSVVGLLLESRFSDVRRLGQGAGLPLQRRLCGNPGAKHPRALGSRFYDIWSEIWPDISPLIESAMAAKRPIARICRYP